MKKIEIYLNDHYIKELDKLIEIEKEYLPDGAKPTYQDIIELLIIQREIEREKAIS